MDCDNCYLNLKNNFEDLNNSLINEGIDELISRCFKQVKENISYLSDCSDLENIDSLNSDSNYIKKSFKIKETQQLFRYCILLLDKEDNIKPEYKLLLENLLIHFQNIYPLENDRNNKFKSKRIYENYTSNDISSKKSSISSILSIPNCISMSECNDLEKQLLYEQNRGK